MADRSLGERQHKAIGTPPFQVPETQSYDTTQPSTRVGAWRKEQDMQMTRVPLPACLLPSTVSCAHSMSYTLPSHCSAHWSTTLCLFRHAANTIVLHVQLVVLDESGRRDAPHLQQAQSTCSWNSY
jgi:hypothetical protein